MSFDWYKWAKKQKNLKPPEKAVLVCIADYYNDEKGCAWPSQETLAEDTSYNRATIHRACKSLKKKGLLSWYKVMLPSGHFSSNRYQLHHVSDSHMAESVVAEKGSAMLHKATSPCSRLQQKPLSEPLVLTLNNSKVVKNSLKLSEKQKHLAEKKAVQLMQAHPNEHFQLQSLIKDCEDFLLSQQREEDWLAIGNGLPNPFN